MNIILEHAEVIWNLVGIVFTALTSFLITKYTYHRNRPLDKFEIAYDKIYYPIHQMLKVENEKLDLQIFAQIDFIKYEVTADNIIVDLAGGEPIFQNQCKIIAIPG